MIPPSGSEPSGAATRSRDVTGSEGRESLDIGTGPTTPEDYAKREELKRGWQRSVRFHLREQWRQEGKPLLELHDNRRGWPGDPSAGPA